MEPAAQAADPATSAPHRAAEMDGRIARGVRSRARIRAAARELFRERGFDGATLRAIAKRAGLGASSIYRHVASKQELLVLEIADLQEEAWGRFRASDDPRASTRARVVRFFESQHDLLASNADLTVIALRATSFPEAPVARQVLALHDRTIGLLTEILQQGRQRDLSASIDVMGAARTLFHTAQGVRTSWANGQLSEKNCRRAIQDSVGLLFEGLEAR